MVGKAKWKLVEPPLLRKMVTLEDTTFLGGPWKFAPLPGEVTPVSPRSPHLLSLCGESRRVLGAPGRYCELSRVGLVAAAAQGVSS